MCSRPGTWQILLATLHLVPQKCHTAFGLLKEVEEEAEKEKSAHGKFENGWMHVNGFIIAARPSRKTGAA